MHKSEYIIYKYHVSPQQRKTPLPSFKYTLYSTKLEDTPEETDWLHFFGIIHKIIKYSDIQFSIKFTLSERFKNAFFKSTIKPDFLYSLVYNNFFQRSNVGGRNKNKKKKKSQNKDIT